MVGGWACNSQRRSRCVTGQWQAYSCGLIVCAARVVRPGDCGRYFDMCTLYESNQSFTVMSSRKVRGCFTAACKAVASEFGLSRTSRDTRTDA
eukprot:1277665-Prymnesium_polylepis.1